MKKLLLLILITLFVMPVWAGSVRVRGYYRKDGTYVKPHYRSSANSTVWDNWSTKGNTNPYTGKSGTINPYTSTQASSAQGLVPVSAKDQPLVPPSSLGPEQAAAKVEQSLQQVFGNYGLSERWHFVGKDPKTETSYFVDNKSMIKQDFWVKKVDKTGNISAPEKITVLCTARKLNWEDVVPETLSESIYDYACQLQLQQ